MLRTVQPHDLSGICRECGIELSDLARFTGISEEELLLFAKGEHPMSARDRYAIFATLEDRARTAHLDAGLRFKDEEGRVYRYGPRREGYGPRRDPRATWRKLRELLAECEEEERQKR